ncbi:MAG: 5-formyltetrahydrofolate cyclo-ligase [Desulfovibrio sp.]|nr:5-formyltetrahydrofolate cyclo-ligase [Desulfovibrio sp.]
MTESIDAHTAKKEWRTRIATKRKQIKAGWVAEQSLRIANTVLSSTIWQTAPSIALYMALPYEVQTDRLCHVALTQNKRVYLPRIVHHGTMEFVPYTRRTPLHKNTFGILEPIKSIEGFAKEAFLEKEKTCLFLLPAVAYDRTGLRLGYGGGFYDRFLSVFPNASLLGLCFSFQLVPSLPEEAWDRRVTLLATEDEWLCL